MAEGIKVKNEISSSENDEYGLPPRSFIHDSGTSRRISFFYQLLVAMFIILIAGLIVYFQWGTAWISGLKD